MALRIQEEVKPNEKIWEIIWEMLSSIKNETKLNKLNEILIDLWMVEIWENIETDNEESSKKMFELKIELWTILLWEYLMFKLLISGKQLNIAYEIQKKQQESKRKWNIYLVDRIWEILVNQKFINKFYLNDAMSELWIDTTEIYELK